MSVRRAASTASAALVAALSLAAVVGGIGAAPAAAEGPDVTWGVRTAANAFGDTRENYAYRVDAGETIEDAIVIANHDDAPIALDVYAADGFTSESGQLDVAPRSATPRDLGSWLVPAADRVVVPPGEAIEVPFTVEVPANATPGDHAGGILTSLVDPEADQGLTVDRRLGIRIHLRVDGALAPELAIDDLRVGYEGTANPFGAGEATVRYTVRNAGNVRLSAGQAVTVAGPFGMLPVAAAGLADVPELLPGETWPVEVRVAGVLPTFAVTATVALDPRAPERADVDAEPVEAIAAAPAIPWVLLVVALLIAAGVVLGLRLARRKRAERQAREDARVQDAVERALQEREQEREHADAGV
ncbi:WxL protein peptidoglycan domain-containing protein [Agromyces sp. MMS24-JH15]|uniref:WxL protein peptidoglycan domain-containing protein n=1 Tax=Agromyces sp. MMS24-JH15 TaxID=3243765 RepID=UPI003747932A